MAAIVPRFIGTIGPRTHSSAIIQEKMFMPLGHSGPRGTAIRAAVIAASLLIPLAAAIAAERAVGGEARTALTLTVYQQDLGLVSERRRIALGVGEAVVALEDVSGMLRPETVLLGGDGLRVLSRSFDADLLTPRRLLEAAVGSMVRVVKTHPETGEESVVEAQLLSVAEGIVLRIGDRIETTVPGRIVFDDLPEGVRAEPTLVVRLAGDGAGDHALELSYLTGGLSWRADYVLSVTPSGDGIDLNALVSLTNQTGTDYEAATVRLLAGEVSQAEDNAPPRPMQEMAMRSAMADEKEAMPAPQAASDRYLYTLPGKIDLTHGEQRQVTLLTASGVPVQRIYRFDELVQPYPGAEEIGPLNAQIVLGFENDAAKGLGQPLPAGTIRVYEGSGDAPLFVGADRIGHTAAGEEIELTLGRAFDVTGEARRTALERLSDRSYETAQEITLRNAKDTAVDVKLVGHMPPGWKILEESAPHDVETANTLAWTLTVPAGGEATLSYRVRVSR